MPTYKVPVQGIEFITGPLTGDLEGFPSLAETLGRDGDGMFFLDQSSLANFQADLFDDYSDATLTESSKGAKLSFSQTSGAGTKLTVALDSSSGSNSLKWTLGAGSASDTERRADALSFGGTTKSTETATKETWDNSFDFSSTNSLGTALKTDDIVFSIKMTLKGTAAYTTLGDERVLTKETKSTTLKVSYADAAGVKMTMDAASDSAYNYNPTTDTETETETINITKFELVDTRDAEDAASISFSGKVIEDKVNEETKLDLKTIKLKTAFLQIEAANIKGTYDAEPVEDEEGNITDNTGNPLAPIYDFMTGDAETREAALDFLHDGAAEVLLTAANKVTLLQAGSLEAGDGADTVIGSSGDDSIDGGDGSDNISAGAGDDTIVASAGTDTVDGGAGDDTLVLGTPPTDDPISTEADTEADALDITVSGTAAKFTITEWNSGATIQASNVEFVDLGDGNGAISVADFLNGSDTISADEVIHGTDGIAVETVDKLVTYLAEGPGNYGNSSEEDRGTLPFGAEVDGLVVRLGSHEWEETPTYSALAANHTIAFTAADGAKLNWADSRTLASTATGDTSTWKESVKYSGTNGDKFEASSSHIFAETYTTTGPKNSSTLTVTHAYSGTLGNETAATTDDTKFTYNTSLTEKYASKYLSSGSEDYSETTTETRSFAGTYANAISGQKFAYDVSATGAYATEYVTETQIDEETGEPITDQTTTTTKDTLTRTVAKFDYVDSIGDDKLTVKFTGSETLDFVENVGKSTLSNLTYDTAAFKSTTASLNWVYDLLAQDEETGDQIYVGLDAFDLMAMMLDVDQGSMAEASAFLLDNLQEMVLAGSNKVTLLTATEFDAGDGADTVTGSAGNDTISGGFGANSLSGGAGDDTFNYSGDSDTIDGGAGNDTLDLTEMTAALNWGADFTVTSTGTGAATKIIIKNWADMGVITASNIETILVDDGQDGSRSLTVAEFLTEFSSSTQAEDNDLDLTLSAAEVIGDPSDFNTLLTPSAFGLVAYLGDVFGDDQPETPEELSIAEIDIDPETLEFSGFLPFNAEIENVAARMAEQAWGDAEQSYDVNADSHKLTYTDAASGAKLVVDDSRSLTATATSTKATHSASFTYTGPTKVAEQKLDALKSSLTETTTYNYRDAKGVQTTVSELTGSYSGTDSNGTSTTSDDIKFSFTHKETETSVDTLTGTDRSKRQITNVESNAGTYTGNGIKLDFVMGGTNKETLSVFLMEDGNESTGTIDQSWSGGLSKFDYQDTLAKFKLSLTTAESGKGVGDAWIYSETVKGFSIDTAAFKATAATFTTTSADPEAQENSVTSVLKSLMGDDGDISGATERLLDILPDLMQGNDVVTLKALTRPEAVDTGAGNDKVTGSANADIILGGEGKDTIDGGTGDDSIDGGSGNDSLLGGAGNDTFVGSHGADTIDGGAGAGDVLDLTDLGYQLGYYDDDYTTNFGSGGTAANFTITNLVTGLTSTVKNVESIIIDGVTLTTAEFLATENLTPEDNIAVEDFFADNEIGAPNFAAILADVIADGGDYDLIAPFVGLTPLQGVMDYTWSEMDYYDTASDDQSLSFTSDEGNLLTFTETKGDNGDHSFGIVLGTDLTPELLIQVDLFSLTQTGTTTSVLISFTQPGDGEGTSLEIGSSHSVANQPDPATPLGQLASVNTVIDSFNLSYSSDAGASLDLLLTATTYDIGQSNGNGTFTNQSQTTSLVLSGLFLNDDSRMNSLFVELITVDTVRGYAGDSLTWGSTEVGIGETSLRLNGISIQTEEYSFSLTEEPAEDPLAVIKSLIGNSATSLDDAVAALPDLVGSLVLEQSNTVTTTRADDTFDAGAGDDTVMGSSGTDVITGGADSDSFDFSDLMVEMGYDTVEDLRDGTTLSGTEGAMTIAYALGDYFSITLNDFETIIAGDQTLSVADFFALYE